MDNDSPKVIANQVMCVHCKILLSTRTLAGELVYYHGKVFECPNSDKFFTPAAITLFEWGKTSEEGSENAEDRS